MASEPVEHSEAATPGPKKQASGRVDRQRHHPRRPHRHLRLPAGAATRPGRPAEACSIADSACLIDGTLHFPSPHVIWTASGEEAAGGFFEISITDTLFTMVLVTVVLLL